MCLGCRRGFFFLISRGILQFLVCLFRLLLWAREREREGVVFCVDERDVSMCCVR